MASEFFQGSDPNEAAKKEEERIMRTMAHKSGKGLLFGNRVVATPAPSAPVTHHAPVATAPVHHTSAAQVPRTFAAPAASSSLFDRAAANAGPAPQAAAPQPVQVPAAPAAPAGTSNLFARAAANAEPAQPHHVAAPAPVPSAAAPAGWPGQSAPTAGVDTSSATSAWSSDLSAEEMARKEEERLRRQFGGMAVSKTAHSAAAPPAPAPSTTKLPEPYAPSVAVVHAPAAATVQSASVPTGEHATVGGQFENELVAELNQARTNPRAFAQLLRDYERHVTGNSLQLPGTNYQVQLKDGVAAVREAAAALEAASPVSPVTMNLAFSQSSLELVREHGARGSTNDEIAESTGAAVRLTRHGSWKKRVIETTAYLPVPAKHVVALWLVDDGTVGRLNRNTLLDPHYAVVGVASGPHVRYGRMVVVDWTEGFTEGHAAPAPRILPVQTAEHEKITSTAHQGVLSELPDGSGFQVDVGVLGVPKSGLAVSLRHGTEVQVQRHDGANSMTYKYQLPFAFTADRVTAEYKPDGRLLIRLLRPVAAAPGVNEVTLAKYVQGAGPATSGRLQIDAKETKEKLQLRTLLSKYAEDITVKLRDGKVVVWECQHLEEDPEGQQIVTSTLTMKLPFEVNASACNVIQHGAEGATTEVLKPTGGAAEVTIPISG